MMAHNQVPVFTVSVLRMVSFFMIYSLQVLPLSIPGESRHR